MQFTREELKRLVHLQGVSTLEKLLLILLADQAQEKPPKQIKEIGVAVGLRAIKNINITQVLQRSKGLAIPVPGGWELSAAGITHLSSRGLIGDVQISQPATQLRGHLVKISNPRIRAFLDEAIVCYETKNYRASTVLSWVGAVALLYEHVLKTKLAAFNAELLRRDPRQKPVVVFDDFSDIKESAFLDILQSISAVGKSVKNELKQRLQLRNGCGHPNSLAIGPHMAAAHLEALITNVYSVF